MQALANPKPKNILSTSFAYADTVYDTETVFATAQDAAAYVRTPCYLHTPDVAFAALQTRRKIKPIAAQDDRAAISINYF